MGHTFLPAMPDTARWPRVVRTIAHGSSVAVVASETSQAAVKGMKLAKGDRGLLKCVEFLLRVVRAARADAFAEGLRDAGMQVRDGPDVYDIVGGFADAVDRDLSRFGGRTDIGEIAQMSAVETLMTLLSRRSATLFERTPAEVRRAAVDLSRDSGFASLAHDFFARFTARFLRYHLDRELPLHVGVGRFADADAHSAFLGLLDTHCREAASIVTVFAGKWYSKHRHLDDIQFATVRGFVNHALDKLQVELERRGARDG